MKSKKVLREIKAIKLELKRYLKQGLITKDDLVTSEEGVNPISSALEKGRAASKN